MNYSRRNFLKAAGAGIALTAVGEEAILAAVASPPPVALPMPRVAYLSIAGDCGFCTAGRSVTAKALLDKNLNTSEDEVKSALSGHICRCAAYPEIVRTVVDTAAVLRGEAEIL